jgi:peptidoglycan hydrolase-like protein with peptidoglycan-binding domain
MKAAQTTPPQLQFACATRHRRISPAQETIMKKLLSASLVALLCLSAFALAQNPSTRQPAAVNTNEAPKKKRGPVFRANKEQVTRAQAVLQQRGFYRGEPTGKLDDATRAALRKYQESEGLKVTGTLNAVTLDKMGIPLTDRQKAMVAAPKTM